MSLRNVETSCPGCQSKVNFDVVVPDPQISVQLVEDNTKVDRLTAGLTESQQSLEQSQQSLDALRGDLQRWQSGESHLTAQDMLNMLQSCPNCRPTLDAFVAEVRNKAVSSLTPDQVKEIAKAQKWWPPPPIEIVPPRLRSAQR